MSTQAVVLCTVAFMSFLVCIPPLIWHCRNGNFPASCLIMWILTQNLFNFINPLIWPDDDFSSRWMGYGYCDIQSKLITGAGVGIAGPLVCIFRSLARVLDTERTTLVPTKGDRRWNITFDVIYCVVIPVVIMVLHFIIQDSRYYIYSIVGCMPAYHSSWVSFVVGYIWPPIILIIACFYCGKVSTTWSTPFTDGITNSYTSARAIPFVQVQTWIFPTCVFGQLNQQVKICPPTHHFACPSSREPTGSVFRFLHQHNLL